MRLILVPLLALLATGCAEPEPEPLSGDEIRERVEGAAEGDHRSAENRERNRWRNPGETMAFFGLQPHWKVVEVWPGGGWYTEVLAPVLRDQGRLVAANFPEDAEGFRGQLGQEYRQKLEAEPDLYDRVRIVDFAPPEHTRLGEPDSADMVLLSRHFHNFIRDGVVDEVLEAAREVLRPGGVLAIIQHRAGEGAEPEADRRTGYVRETWLIQRVDEAGFALEDRSEINANPDDPRDHPEGVWTLPPTLRYCQAMEDESERSECEQHYRSIGESDRMTLRFVKPE